MTTCPLPPFPTLPVEVVPAWLLGQPLQQLAAHISPYALPIATRCRTDRSGFIVDRAHAARPYDPSATVSGYSRPTTESGKRTPNSSQLVVILSPKLSPGLPIGGQKGIPPLTVSAPNRPQNANLLQNRRDRGAARRPRRPPPSRHVRRSRRVDASTSSANRGGAARPLVSD